jgi:hypothetical protein
VRVLGVALAVAIGATVPGVFVGLEGGVLAPASLASIVPAATLERYDFSTTRSLHDVAFEVRVDVVRPSECRLSFAAAGSTTRGGPEFVKVVQTMDGRAWSAMNADGLAQLHAEGLLDTRDTSVQQEGERWAVQSLHRRPELVGEFSWFFAAASLAPWPDHDGTGADSLRFSFVCDGPFRLVEVLHADHAVLVNERSLDSGQTVHLGPLGTLVRDESVRVPLGSSQSRMMVGQSANEGTLRLRSPQGMRELDLVGAASFHSFAAGAGEYGIGLDCRCTGAFWAVFAALDPVAGLDSALGATD